MSLTAAAVLGCTCVIGTGGWTMTGSAAQIIDYSNDELFPVVVKVSGEAVMATPEGEALGADFLETNEAAQISDCLESVQKRVQRSIRSFYPELNVKFSYSTLINGFCCELPESLIPIVEKFSDVVSVTKLSTDVKLQMATAPELGGYPAYYDITGCTGEGSVIAVIDSELFADHPMFSALPEDIETKLSKEDIETVINSGDLNINITADQAYHSSKLPFAASYATELDPTQIENTTFYHGTHVSGIAAGNEFEDADGNIISGIAKDAQLLFFRVSSDTIDIDFGAAIAATEDAVKLGADVINMSFGIEREYFGDDPFAEAITTAENAGVLVCMAAANSANSAETYGMFNETNNPDVSTLTDKAEKGQASLVVASADNVYTEHLPVIRVDEQLIPYRSYCDFESEWFMFDVLGMDELEYVYCGAFDADALANVDLTDKIILADFDENWFFSVSEASMTGALGILFIDTEVSGGIEVIYSLEGFPAGIVSYSDGQIMINAENPVIYLSDETVDIDHATKVSNYTSWGVKQSLDLRPDIMGIGGHIESAGYDSTTEILSGTSMATPYLCGCVAEIMQYLRLKDSTLTGRAKIEFIQNLLMNSAFPYYEDFNGASLYVSPRRQGAGMVSLNNAVNTKAMMTGEEGIAKVNLYDNLSDTFSFYVNLQNISDEDVVFSGARLELTTDDFYFEDAIGAYCASGQRLIPCSADLSALTQIGAGENNWVNVTVSLDANETAALQEVFANGFFVEGYLMLEGAENCADISIPLLGFYGDWAQVPILTEQTGIMQLGNRSVFSGNTVADKVRIILDAMNRIAEESDFEYPDADYDDYYEDDFDGDGFFDEFFILNYLTEEEMEAFFADGTAYLSPNGDGLADRIAMGSGFVRFSQYSVLLYNADGEEIGESYRDSNEMKYDFLTLEGNADLSSLPEGTYTLVIAANIDYPTSYENPQTYALPFVIDQTAPEVTSEIVERDGRKILTLTASDDNALEGVYITGSGFGGIAGVYDPENPVNPDAYTTQEALQVAFDWLGAAELEYTPYNDSALPTIARYFNGSISESEMFANNFMDIIPAEADENGVFTLEYDVTDLQNYSVSVADRAFNFVEADATVQEMLSIDNGVWYGNDGFYEIHKGTIRYADYADGEVVKYNYTFKNNTLTMSRRTEIVSYFVEKIGDGVIRLTDGNGNKQILNQMDEYYDLPIFHTAWEIEQACIAYTSTMVPYAIEDVRTVVYNPYDVRVSMVINVEDLQHVSIQFTGSLFSDEFYSDVTMFPENVFIIPTSVILPGTYVTYNTPDGEAVLAVFDEDSLTGTIYTTGEADPMSFSYTYNEDDTVTFDIPDAEASFTASLSTDESNSLYLHTEDDEIIAMSYMGGVEFIDEVGFYKTAEIAEMVLDYEEAVTGIRQEIVFCMHDYGSVMVVLSNDVSYQIDYLFACGIDSFDNFVDLTAIPVLENPAFTLEELAEMSANDYELKTGSAPADASARIDQDSNVVVIIQDETGEIADKYTIDSKTGCGVDMNGEEVNLPQTGINTPSDAVAAAAALIMTLIGAGAITGSGVLRRKKDSE